MGLPTYLTDRVPLGIVDTHMWAREKKSGKTCKSRKEGQRWIDGYEAGAGIIGDAAGVPCRQGGRFYCRCWCGRQSWSTRQITSSAAATTVHCRKVKSCGRKCRRGWCWAGSPFCCRRGRASCAGSHPGDQSCAGRVEERQRCRAAGDLHPSGRNWGTGSGKAVVWWRLTNKAVTILDRGGGSD